MFSDVDKGFTGVISFSGGGRWVLVGCWRALAAAARFCRDYNVKCCL